MTQTRREMLCNTAAGGASFAAAGLMANCGGGTTMVGAPKEIMAALGMDGKISVSLTQNAFLNEAGGASLVRYNVPSGLSFNVPTSGVLLVHRGSATDQPEWIAVNAVCTHAACFVNYDTAAKEIACPCHDARYAAKSEGAECLGDLRSGPATSAIGAYTVTVAGGMVSIDLRTPPSCGPGRFQAKVANGSVELPFADVKELGTVGGSWKGQPVGLADTLIVVRTGDTTASALSAICTHAGCPVAYRTAEKDFRCGCHGSMFSVTGMVTMGPAGKALKQYQVSVAADRIIVTI